MCATGREGLGVKNCEFVAPRAHSRQHAVSLAWVGSIRACREPPFVMKSVAGSCGVLAVHRLFVPTSYRICPFAVTFARLVRSRPRRSLFSLLFSFPPVWRMLQRPFRFCFAAEDEGEGETG